MKREFKFRAWIPELKIMLNDVSYHDGMIGYDALKFEKALPDKHELIDDEVYHKDFENGNDIFERIMTVLTGEEWIWLERGEFELMEYTGWKDKNEVEIYEGDIVREKLEDSCEPEGFFWCKSEVKRHENGAWVLCQVGFDYSKSPFDEYSVLMDDHKNLEVTGNIFEGEL